MTFNIDRGCADLQILKKVKMAELSGLLWWNFAYIFWQNAAQEIVKCRGSISVKQWNWPYLLKLFEYFDKIMLRHCYWRELDRGIAKWFIISRGYAEVQILINKWIWPFQLLEHFDMHLSKFWKKKKKKLRRTLHIFICKKRCRHT